MKRVFDFQLGSRRHNIVWWLPFILIGAAYVHAASVGWLKWGDVLVDAGREFDLPRQMLEGKHLYSDLRFYYGPLAPIVNSALYALFGIHAYTLITAGLACALLTAVGLYRIVGLFLDRISASVVAILFLYLCAFGHVDRMAIFNFVVPYTYAATYGMLAAVWCLYFLLRYQQGAKPADLWLSGALLVLASLSKLETLLPALAIHVMALVLATFHERRRTRAHIMVLSCAVAAATSVVVVLTWHTGAALWRDNIASLFNSGSTIYLLTTLGLDDPAQTFAGMIGSCILLGVTVLVAHAVAELSHRARSSRLQWSAVTVSGAIAFTLYSQLYFTLHFASLPLVAVIAFAAALYLYARQPNVNSRWAMHALLWTFVLAAVARIALRVGAYKYGFYLIPVGLAGLALVYIDYLPRLLPRNPWMLRSAAASALGAAVAISSTHWANSEREYQRHRYEVVTSRGRLLVNNPFVPQVLNALSRYPRDSRLLVIPQGAGLIFFSGLQAADGMFSYLPMEFFGSYTDAGVLQRWRSHPPDLVVWYDADLKEFGYTAFGVDYASRSANWLRQNYGRVPGQAALFTPRQR